MGIERKILSHGEVWARERFNRTIGFVQEAFANGHFAHLAPGQREALMTLYPLGDDSDTGETPLTFTEYGNELGVSSRAIEDRHRRALKRLERINNGQPPVEKSGPPKLEIDIGRVRTLLEAGYTRKEVAGEVGCSKSTLESRNREHGIVLKKGRPIK